MLKSLCLVFPNVLAVKGVVWVGSDLQSFLYRWSALVSWSPSRCSAHTVSLLGSHRPSILLDTPAPHTTPLPSEDRAVSHTAPNLHATCLHENWCCRGEHLCLLTKHLDVSPVSFSKFGSLNVVVSRQPIELWLNVCFNFIEGLWVLRVFRNVLNSSSEYVHTPQISSKYL